MLTFLDIALNNCCTYSCDYCASRASTATAQNFKDSNGRIYGVYIPNGHQINYNELMQFAYNLPSETIVQVSGGEPMIHPAFAFIVTALAHYFDHVIINTNGNQAGRLSLSLLELPNLYWRASWHRDFRNIKAFLEDIIRLPKEKTLINYVAHPKRIKDGIIQDDLLDLEMEASLKNNWKYEVTAFEGEWSGYTFSKDWKGYDGIITVSNDEYPAQDVLYHSIRPNGDVVRCAKGATLGNIYEPHNLTLDEDPKKCERANGSGNTVCPLLLSSYMLGIVK